MRATEHDTKLPVTTTGFFAALRGFVHVPGTGALSSTPAVNPVQPQPAAGKPSRPRGNHPLGGVAIILITFVSLLLAPSVASAEFTRPYITQITGTTGPHGEQVPFVSPLGGLAVDPVGGGVWVGDTGAGVVDEFDSSNVFVEQVTGVSTGSLAYDDTGMKLLGAGALEQVAVDDSVSLQDEARGDVYRAADGNGEPESPSGGVRRVGAEGVAAPFTCPEGIAAKYITNTVNWSVGPVSCGAVPPIQRLEGLRLIRVVVGRVLCRARYMF